MNVDPTTARWIDGGKLLRWLENDRRAVRTEHTEEFEERFGRMLRGWRTEGRKTRVHVVDEFLCSIGVCLGEVPEEFYCEDPRTGKAPYGGITPEQSERMVKLHRLDWTFDEIAAMVGCGRRTVARHVRKAEMA